MLSRLYKLIAGCRRSPAFTALLVPALVLATLPHTACVCADGHQEPICNVWACCAANEAQAKGSPCGCSCCKQEDGETPRACCQSKHRLTKSGQQPPAGVAAKQTHCCQPIAAAPVPVASTKPSDLPAHSSLVSVVPHVLSLAAFVSRQVWAQPPDNHHGPPPLDAVILYLHLTI